ncbi:hypothetical protein [Parafrankia discariae]|uniref:hypothetical protein n=1 Tax=Parafrankia discariae TaxID=365528 RepID=UPI0003A595F3|nr:hypothetical protein [Parafrankia discariae]
MNIDDPVLGAVTGPVAEAPDLLRRNRQAKQARPYPRWQEEREPTRGAPVIHTAGRNTP